MYKIGFLESKTAPRRIFSNQADFLNKSINFFKEKEKFDFDEFTTEVLEDPNFIESFSNFKSDYDQEMQVF